MNPWSFDYSYRTLSEDFYQDAIPDTFADPRIALWNSPLAEHLGFPASADTDTSLAAAFLGKPWREPTQPLAQAYAGHQFGHFTMLGDGRAVLLGERRLSHGEHIDIQLKGSGRTPFSRRGDGRAALGPMLREYLISEAMHGLGIPTTRSLAVITTGENVHRTGLEPGAVLVRIAASHLRVGTFEFARAKDGQRLLPELISYALSRHPSAQLSDNPALTLFDAVLERQRRLIVEWMRVGFIHGVMNTDNMTLSGETIDYGPCAFMDRFNPQQVFSSIDESGRYAYSQQPIIAQWNLARFAETLLDFFAPNQVDAIRIAEERLDAFSQAFQDDWTQMMLGKIGLPNSPTQTPLIHALLDWMTRTRADFTGTFRGLSARVAAPHSGDDPEFVRWQMRWRDALTAEARTPEDIKDQLNRTNPLYIPRNHRVEAAISAAVIGNFAPVRALVSRLQTPYVEQTDGQADAEPGPDGPYHTFCGT